MIAPVVVIDSREQMPLPFSQLASRTGTLYSGDYSIAGAEELFAIERKTVPDLVSCCCTERDRFKHELHWLRGSRFKRLIIVGSEAEIFQAPYRSNVSPKAVLATLHCLEVRYDLPFSFFPSPELAGRQIERWAIWFAREVRKSASLLEVETARLSKTGRLSEQPHEKQPTATDIQAD